MRLLLPHLTDADVYTAAGPERQTALHVAADMGAPRACRLLLDKAARGHLTLDAALAATDAAGRTAHALAVERGNAPVAVLLATGPIAIEEEDAEAADGAQVCISVA